MAITVAVQNKLGQVMSIGDQVCYPRRNYGGSISLVSGKIEKVVVKTAYSGRVRSYVTIRVVDGRFSSVRCIKNVENLIKLG